MRFAVFFHVSMLSMKVNSIVILNFHWDLLYIVDMSECEKGSFWEVSVPKTSAAAIFSGDLYIFAKYAPVFSNSAFPTTFASHPLPCANVRPNEVIQFLFVFWARCQLIGNTGKYVNVITPPHPTPPLRDVTHLQRSMTYVRNCAHVQVNVPWRNIMGVRKYVNVITPPHPTPPRTCK